MSPGRLFRNLLLMMLFLWGISRCSTESPIHERESLRHPGFDFGFRIGATAPLTSSFLYFRYSEVRNRAPVLEGSDPSSCSNSFQIQIAPTDLLRILEGIPMGLIRFLFESFTSEMRIEER